MFIAARATCSCLVLWFNFHLAAGTAAAAEDSLSEERGRAVRQGVAYLLRQQGQEGGWFSSESPYGDGRTALCTLALIESGMDPDDPALKSAMDRVLQFPEPKYTYTSALQTVILCRLSPAEHRPIIERNVRWLERTQITDGHCGAWAYGSESGKGDGSNTRFAVWALHEAAAAGVTVRPRVWKRTIDYWLNTQRDNGGWRYFDHLPTAGGITLDGIACLHMAARHLPADKQRRRAADEASRRAWAWLEGRFRVDRNPSDDDSYRWHHFYYLYVLADAATLDQRDSIGNRSWRREGTELLLRIRDPLGGGWLGVGLSDGDRRIATSFALLFLAAAGGHAE